MWALHILLLFCGVIFVGGEKHAESRFPSAFNHTNTFRPGLIHSLFLLLLIEVQRFLLMRGKRKPSCATGSPGTSPQPLGAAVLDPRDTSWDSLHSPLPSLINTGSAEIPQTSSALLCELTSDCTWICKNALGRGDCNCSKLCPPDRAPPQQRASGDLPRPFSGAGHASGAGAPPASQAPCPLTSHCLQDTNCLSPCSH